MPKPRRSRISTDIQIVRRSLKAFDRSLRRLAWMVGQLNGSIERRRKARTGSRKPLSAKARASLKLHGQYIGHLRHLKPKHKADVRKVKEGKGVRAAIATAKVLARA